MIDKDTFVALERRFWDSVKDRDGATAMELSDDPALLVGSQGIAEVPRQALGPMIEQPIWRVLSYEIKDFVVREVAPGAVITAYKVIEELVAEEGPFTLEAYDSSVWVGRDDSWVCSLHTESLVGDPLGRDRPKAQER